MGCSQASRNIQNHSRPWKLHVQRLHEAKWSEGVGDCKFNSIHLFHSQSCFSPPNQDKESIQRVLQAVDKANGYCFGVQEQRSLEAMMSAAMGADFHFSSYPCSSLSHSQEGGDMGFRNGHIYPRK